MNFTFRMPASFKIVCIVFFIFCAAIYSAKAQTYCIPESACSDFYRFHIDSVAFGSIRNASGCSEKGYADYSSKVATANITAGTYVPVFIKAGNPNMPKNVKLAIDFNQNGKFDPDEITDLGGANETVSRLIKIPFNALTGRTRMRVMAGNFITDMCATTIQVHEFPIPFSRVVPVHFTEVLLPM